VAIGGLGETAAKDLVEHRYDREFVSVEDLSLCCPKVSKTHIEQMKVLGVLGQLPDTSQISLFS
jgi:DNA polymerase-3 subunit alpha (Gram-positive type)